MDHQKFISQNPQETYQLGQHLGQKIKKPAILCLYGELGSGKTTFTQGLASGLGITKRIISPTFTFIKQYPINKPARLVSESVAGRHLTYSIGQGDGITLYHIDLYRLKTSDEITSLGIEEILSDKKAIIAIEWPEKIKNILPNKKIEIYFKYLTDTQREIKTVFF